MKLSDAVDEYVQYRRNAGYAKNTVRVEAQALSLLLAEIGNISTSKLDARHGERYMSAMLSAGLKPGTVNLYRGAFRRFTKWCYQRRYLAGAASPLGTTRNIPVVQAPRRRIPAHEFPRLLDACWHPQQRIIVALGLYLFIRASEVADLDVSRVYLDRGVIEVWQRKTQRWDEMPICAELDVELRRWLTWYANDQSERGPLMPHWPLVPARKRTNMFNDGTGKCGGRPMIPAKGQMNPDARLQQGHLKVQQALRGFGWDVTADDREGGHTLRRSGARALFDHLCETGEVRDGVLRLVSSFLHHKSVQTTERYLGLEADRENRNRMFSGKPMFATTTSDVVQLHPVTAMVEG